MVKIFNNLLIVFMLLFSLAACEKEGDVATEPGSYPDYELVLENQSEGVIILSIEIDHFYCDIDDERINNINSGVVIDITLEADQLESFDLLGFPMGFPYKHPNYGIYQLYQLKFLDNNGNTVVNFHDGNLVFDELDHEWFTESDDRPFYLELDEEDETVARIIIIGEPQQ